MYEYKGKRLLILGGAFQHCKVVEAAHRVGMTAYVADYLENSPAKKLADKSAQIDVKDIELLSEFCIREKIDGVINTSLDPCQIPYQKLCEKMGYPCFGTRKQFQVLTNKRMFKEYFSRYGVDVIQTYCMDDIRTNKAEYPILVKPVDSRGSRGQSICMCREDVGKAVEDAKKESSTGEIVMERFMGEHDDFSVAYLVVEGNPVLVRAGDRYQGTQKMGLHNVAVAAAEPSKYLDMYMQNVHKYVVNGIKGLGIQNGPVFMQGFIDKDTVRFYDPGFRFAGGEYERLLKQIAGIDLIEILVKFAISGKILNTDITDQIAWLNGKRIMQLCPTMKNGTIKSIKGVEELLKNPAVITYFPRYQEGDEITLSHDVGQRFAEICFITDSAQSEAENIRFVQKTLHVLDQDECEMICDPFDIRRLKEKNGGCNE